MKLVFEPSMSVRFLTWKKAAFDGPLVIGKKVAYPSASPQVVPPLASLSPFAATRGPVGS
jgi:hypothetical protein